MENFQSDLYGRTGTVQVKSGMSIDYHTIIAILKGVFWSIDSPNGRAVQSWEVC